MVSMDKINCMKECIGKKVVWVLVEYGDYEQFFVFDDGTGFGFDRQGHCGSISKDKINRFIKCEQERLDSLQQQQKALAALIEPEKPTQAAPISNSSFPRVRRNPANIKGLKNGWHIELSESRVLCCDGVVREWGDTMDDARMVYFWTEEEAWLTMKNYRDKT